MTEPIERARQFVIKYYAAIVAGQDMHLGRTWRTNGDIVSDVAGADGGVVAPLTPEECDLAVETYDAFLAIFEEERSRRA